jgi:hypothetical protein
MKQFSSKHPGSKSVLTFDFTKWLGPVDILSGSPVVTVTASGGRDTNPSAILNGSAVFDATTRKIEVAVKDGLDGVDYVIDVSCATTNTLKRAAMSALLPVRR